jgi:hypothetical protein
MVIANDREDIRYMIRKLMEEYEKWELNTPKTKYLRLERRQTHW